MTGQRPIRTALVTGAGEGIGKAIAHHLVLAGHRVILCGRRRDALDAAAADLGPSVVVAPFDATDAGAARATLDPFVGPGGGIDILVNNAGLMGNPANVGNGLVHQLRRSLDANLLGPAMLCELLVPAMMERGWGRVVMVASTAGLGAPVGQAPYSVSKAAVIALTRALAMDCADKGVTVNAVAPGPVATERYRATKGDAAIRARAMPVPTGRLSTPDEVAAAVAFLVSDGAAQITGQTLAIDGGEQAAGPYAAMWPSRRSIPS